LYQLPLLAVVAEEKGLQLLLLRYFGLEKVAVENPEAEGELGDLAETVAVGHTGKGAAANFAAAIVPAPADAAGEGAAPRPFHKEIHIRISYLRLEEAGRSLFLGERDLFGDDLLRCEEQGEEEER